MPSNVAVQHSSVNKSASKISNQGIRKKGKLKIKKTGSLINYIAIIKLPILIFLINGTQIIKHSKSKYSNPSHIARQTKTTMSNRPGSIPNCRLNSTYQRNKKKVSVFTNQSK